MRVYIHIPDTLLNVLRDQATAAHRPPRYHLEWLIQQALRERSAALQVYSPHEKEASHVQQPS
jgi:hypothetical protein